MGNSLVDRKYIEFNSNILNDPEMVEKLKYLIGKTNLGKIRCNCRKSSVYSGSEYELHFLKMSLNIINLPVSKYETAKSIY